MEVTNIKKRFEVSADLQWSQSASNKRSSTVTIPSQLNFLSIHNMPVVEAVNISITSHKYKKMLWEIGVYIIWYHC